MAKIPMGNFGNAMPQVQRVQLPQDQSGQMIANTLQNVGQVAEQQHQRQVEKDRLQGATVASNFSLDIENLAGDYRQRVAAGEDATLIDREFSTEFAKRLDDTLLQIPETVRKDFAPKFTNFGNQQIVSFHEIGRKTEVETAKTKVRLSLENFAKNEDAVIARQGAIETLQAARSLLTPSEALLFAQDFNQNLSLNTVNRKILTATKNSDINGLDAIDSELAKEDGEHSSLGGQTINQLRSTIASRKLSIEQHQRQEAKARESTARTTVDDFIQNVISGLPIDDKYRNDVDKLSQGTDSREDFEIFDQNRVKIQKFIGMDTNSKKAFLDNYRTRLSKTPTAKATRDMKLYNTFLQAYNTDLDMAKNDPTGYAASQNQDIKRITGIDVISNPAQAVKNILHNDTVLQTLRKTEPNVTLDPIGKDDLDSIKQSLERATVPQTLGFMSQLIKQVPKNAYGQNLTEKIFKQLGNGSDSYLFASQALANNLNYKGTSVASGILQGQRLIQQKNMIIPLQVESTFRLKMGNLSHKGDFNADLDALSSMYAFYASKKGINHLKSNDAIDDQAFNDAFNAVTGGVYTQQKEGLLWGWNVKDDWRVKNANFTLDDNEVDSWQVEMPYGMDESKFKPRLEDSYKRASELSGIPVSFLKSNYRLQLRDNTNLTDTTIYDLLNANGEKLTTKDKNGKTVGYFLRVYRNK